MSVFEETVFGIPLNQLKNMALDIELELKIETGWFKRRKLRRQLASIMDEIDYQEGRKQFEDRPYSKPSARL